jgi:hypothetical protein
MFRIFFENAAPRKFGSPVLLFLRAASAKISCQAKKYTPVIEEMQGGIDSRFKI